MKTSKRAGHPGNRQALRPRAIRLLSSAGIMLCVSMLALGAYVQLEARRDTWRQAERASENVLLALEQDIARNMATLDLSMQGAVEALADPDIDRVSTNLRHQAMFDRAASAEYLGSILVLGPTGDIVEDSTSRSPHQLNLGSRDYFQAHRDRSDAGLFLSRPFRSRLRDGDLSIALSRRLPSADGTFQGVIASTLRLSYFWHLFERLQLGEGGSVTLIRPDGVLVARYPSSERDFGRNLGGTPVFEALTRQDAGSYVGAASLDGVERLFTFRRVRGLPLILSVNVSVDQVFAAWRAKTVSIGLILTLLSGSTMALCILFRNELLRRERAERVLKASARNLQEIATRDGLTNLINRRGFEEGYKLAWNQAVVEQTSLGLLMLDADFFKLFNDNYGHPAGDRALKAIANCLRQHTREETDLCARYGGEEFVIILSKPDARGSASTAERIRHAVEGLGIRHAASSTGRMTVSMGLAVLTPRPGDLPEILVKAADDALYAAKQGGRNRVQMANFGMLSEEAAVSPGQTDAAPGPMLIRAEYG